ncbi:hypothetical protein, partial [Chryseobacterium indoltheticum]|uniref:hypothetical protein n=1 Tax=Chryseobacterium indoltheticum TaxID=254 RepID=UPI003F496384
LYFVQLLNLVFNLGRKKQNRSFRIYRERFRVFVRRFNVSLMNTLFKIQVKLLHYLTGMFAEQKN